MVRTLFNMFCFALVFDEQRAAHEESFYPAFERTTRGPSSDKRLATDMFRKTLGSNKTGRRSVVTTSGFLKVIVRRSMKFLRWLKHIFTPTPPVVTGYFMERNERIKKLIV
jgi:hypothetical protein